MVEAVFYGLIHFAPLWLGPLLVLILWEQWTSYSRFKTFAGENFVLLEIKLPRELTKSPAAMEIILTSMYQPGAATFLEKHLLGKIKTWFSLELVSTGGQVRFFIWTPDKYQRTIESQIYAQYPTVEIFEAPDYTADVTYDPAEMIGWGTYFKLSEADVYPIKTYIDYGLDKDPKEEFKIDPLTAVLEYLGSMKSGEHAWIQILIQAHTKTRREPGRWFWAKRVDWKNEARKEIEKIRKEATPERTGSEFPGFPNPTKGQVEKIAALERSINKFAFETMIRGFYLASQASFHTTGITGLIGSMRQYSSRDLNGFSLGWFTDLRDWSKDLRRILGWIPGVDALFGRRVEHYKRQMLEAYKLRSFFQPPYKNFHLTPFILNTEELATIFHFPGQAAATPSLAKIESKRGEPPVNLPM
ncbi:MAG: hypothetical protein HYT48_01020 [Candidatus Vogelbacteria bacterium]|nr:hypothetical protein [Candidatus Vogelbacteria bacterium]